MANAIFGRADAVMLSGETAVGCYPKESVETMARIVVAAEEAAPPPRPLRSTHGSDVQAAVSAAASDLGADLEIAAIVPLTQSGATAMSVARYRPEVQIVAATPLPETARLLTLAWGVQAVVLPFSEETSVLLDRAACALADAGYVERGQLIAITAGLSTRTRGGTDFIHVRVV